MHDYDRRTAASDTPVFDQLFKNHAKVEVTLNAASKKLFELANKLEKASPSSPATLDLLGKAVDAAYLVFAPFRDLLSRGPSELDKLKNAEFDAAKQARNLFTAVKSDLNQAYNAVAQAKQDKDGESAAKASHDLSVAVSTLKTIFHQFVEAYGH